MTPEDRAFAIDYYYENLLKEMGISCTEWRNTLDYFLFYEYCEWVFVGNKYNAQNSEYYKKYLPIAKLQAQKIKSLQDNEWCYPTSCNIYSVGIFTYSLFTITLSLTSTAARDFWK